MTSRRARALLLLACLLAAAPARGEGIFDPALRFTTFATPHFVIYFHQGELPAARRLAAIAEETWSALGQPFGVTPPGRTHVVLVDQTETANGFATPLPRDSIVVTAAAPPGSEFIGRHEDWLRLVFTHEFTHIVHLDRSTGLARLVRGVFGRAPLAFPNLFLPTWQIEGLATYEESRLTGDGRLHAGDFRAVVTAAAQANALLPLDRVNGGLSRWPDGFAPYAYGLAFHAYLADRYGEDRLASLAEQTAGRVPYTQSRLFRRVYGKSLGALWREFEEASVAAAPTAPASDTLTRITRHRAIVSGPRFVSAAHGGAPGLVYAVRGPDGFPALNEVALDGTSPRQLTTRFLGSTSGVHGALVVFDQQEIQRNLAVHSDLYVLDRRDGRVRPLTAGARLVDPDVSPDGRTIVCVREGDGHRALVLLGLTGGAATPDAALVAADPTGAATLVDDPAVQFNAPRWSPDGARIVVERHRVGALSEIVLVDPSTRAITPVVSGAAIRAVTPTWRPDGGAIVAAVAADDGPFNLWEFPLAAGAPARALTRTTGGATWPDISPDGTTIAFVGYTADGFDLFTTPYAPTDDAPALPLDRRADAAPSPSTTLGPALLPSRYTPLATLAPTAWSPLVEATSDEVRAGVMTNGGDVLGYHAYGVSATWLAHGPRSTTRPARGTPDWRAVYAYTRWRPTVFVSASAETSFFAGPPTDAGTPENGTLREHAAEGGIAWPTRRVRATHVAFASLFRSADTYTLDTARAARTRAAARLAWTSTTARRYGYSISPEDGVSAGVTAEFAGSALGASGDATTLTGDVRGYLHGAGAHHVLALRAAGGFSTGDAVARRTFLLGGPDASPALIGFGSTAFRLLRAFPTSSFAGTHVAVANAEYRWPIVRLERGAGTFPLFVHTVHAAAFADAAHAWTGTFRAGDIKTSAGAELSADLVLGYGYRLTATIGAATGRDGATGLSHATLYARVGRSF